MKISKYILSVFISLNLLGGKLIFGQIIVYNQDFETSNDGWTNFEIIDSTTKWSRSNSSFPGNTSGHWHITPFNTYANDQILLVESPTINTTGKNSITFSSFIRYQTEAAWDGWKVQYSADNGNNWNDLGSLGSGINWYNDTDVDAIENNADGWSGNNSTWQTASVSLPTILDNNPNVKIRFYFASDYTISDFGVAFDDINLSDANGVFYSEDFNTNDGGWKNIFKDPPGFWVRDNSSFAGNTSNHWHISPHNNYANLIDAGLTSEKYDFRAYKNLTLSFSLRYDTENNWDGMIVEYTTDSVTWQQLGALGDGTNWYNNTSVAIFGTGTDAWSGDNGAWQTVSIPLPSTLDYIPNVYFRFRFKSDSFFTTDDGVAIDDVKIEIPSSISTFITQQSGEIRTNSTWLGNSRPSNESDAFIANGHVVTLSRNRTINYNLSLLEGATIDLNGFTLTANRNLNFELGSIVIPNGGKIIFANNGDQTIGGTELYDVELRGSGVKMINVPLTISHEMLISANITLNTNDHLILKSTESYTARLLAVPAGATINGKLKMERFIPANQRTWWQMSSPYSDATVADYQEFFPITGAFSGTDVLDGLNNTSIYSYDETNTSSDYNVGWTAFPSANSLENFSPGTGYRIYLREDKTNAIGDLNVSVLGTPNVGDVSLPVTFTSTAGVDADGWSFVGNPYPCDIDWDNASWTKTNVANAIYVWDAATSQYMTYVDGIGTNNGSQYIASSQGFWVRTTASSPVLTAKETVKTTNNTAFKRETLPSNVLFIEISEGTNSANTAIRFNEFATSEFDNQFDAEFLGSSNIVGICSHSSDLSKFYSINSLPDSPTQIPFWVIHSNTKKSRNLTFNNIESFDSEDKLYLIDKYLKDTVLLYEGLEYTFSNNNTSASNGSQRFEIMRMRPTLVTSIENKLKETLEIYPSIITKGENINITSKSKQNATITITDLLGKVWYKNNLELNGHNSFRSPQQNGIYLVHVIINDQETIYKILVE